MNYLNVILIISCVFVLNECSIIPKLSLKENFQTISSIDISLIIKHLFLNLILFKNK